MSVDCTTDIEVYLRRTGEFIMKAGLSLIVGTVFWTLYLVSVIVTVYVLWRKGLNRIRTALLVSVLLIFILDTVSFSINLYTFFHQTREILLKGIFEGDGLKIVESPVATLDVVCNVLSLFMLITGDCIVIWRAYMIWTGSRIVMFIPVLLFLGCIVNLPIYIACNIRHENDLPHGIATACLGTDASAWILSFSANISATLTIFYTAWFYYMSQKVLRELGIPRPRFSPVAKIMQLFIESGLAYLLIMIFSIIITLYPTPSYGLGTVVSYILALTTTQCIGMVPTLTILLVIVYGSFDEDDSVTEILRPISFVTPRVTVESSYPSVILPPARRESGSEPRLHSSHMSLPEMKS
ncbi:hypothetical protein C8J56DRAFT_963302 [Mycena floridula]|nr:hypothetical protein C8J56DRAFT_963302 [Mycena floridula]